MSGIAENDYSWSIKLYPNPASDELFIGINLENEELNIQIIDVTGKVVTNEYLRTKEFIGRLNLSLKDGIYFVNLTNKNKETIVKKLVISK